MPELAPHDIEMTLRILMAFILGALLGWERERAGRPAGLRTFMMVTAGSAAYTVVSIWGFSGEGTVRDPGRVAAQVVSGIGFLGAGTIFRTPSTVRGLTTAASIWLVAGIGLLIGTGMYTLATFTTGCGYVALQWLRYPSHRRRRRVGEPSLAADDGDDAED